MKKNLLILLFVFAFTFSSSTYAQDDKYKDYLNLSSVYCKWSNKPKKSRKIGLFNRFMV